MSALSLQHAFAAAHESATAQGGYLRRRSETVSYWGSCGPARQGGPTPAIDPGRVKTPKGRSRRGIVFYRRRGFRVVLPLLARTLGLEKKAVLRVVHAPAF